MQFFFAKRFNSSCVRLFQWMNFLVRACRLDDRTQNDTNQMSCAFCLYFSSFFNSTRSSINVVASASVSNSANRRRMRMQEPLRSSHWQLKSGFPSKWFWFHKSLQLKFRVGEAKTRLCFINDSPRWVCRCKTDSTLNKKIPKIGKAILKSFSCFLKLTHELLAV